MEETRTHDVIVIGAGFAGLTAARDLSARGLRVLILESRDRIGGRTWYKEFPGSGHCVEYGGTWFSTESMSSLAGEIGRYGVEVVDQPAPQAFLWDTGGQQRSHAPIPPDEFGAAEAFLVALHRVMETTPGGVIIPGTDYSESDIPITEWEPTKALPAASREFVYAWASMYGGCAPEEVSVLHYARMMAEFGNRASALYDGLAQKFAHGTVQLAEALRADSNAEILLSQPVTSVTQDGTQVQVQTPGGLYASDRVVCTVPLNTLHRIQFDPPLPAAQEVASKIGHPCRSIKVWARATGVPDGLFALGWGGPIQWLSNEYALDNGESLVVGFGYAPEALDFSLVGSVQEAIRQYAPDAVVLSCDGHDWQGDPNSDGAWSVWGPGWITGGHSAAFNTPHDRVHFASSDLARQWPGWIDGAIHSGASRARDIAELFRTTNRKALA